MKNSAVKTFGILTSGGDAPGLNAAIRGVARTAMNQYGMKVIGIEEMVIEKYEAVNKSYPSFFDDLVKLGVKLHKNE